MGSPPPPGSKKVVLKLRSVNNIVSPPAKTGKDNTNMYAVTITAHKNKGICPHVACILALTIVVMKFIEPKIDLTPAKWREKIAKSTLAPL